MTREIFQANYEALASISTLFKQQAEGITTLQTSIKTTMEHLIPDWQGEGAHAFFNTMHAALLPAVDRLITALQAGQTLTSDVATLIREAEEEAANVFEGAHDGVGAGVGSNGSIGEGTTKPSTDDPETINLRDSSRDTPGWPWGTNEFYYAATYATKQGQVSPDGISPTDVKQGSIGNCYFMAGLISVAQQNPDVIKNAIKDNGDGTYTVTFYEDGKPFDVTVDNDFPMDKDGNPAYAKNGSTPDELWPMIMEKAYAKHSGNSYKEIEYGYPEDAVELLTGKPSTRLDIDASSPADQTAFLKDLETRLNNGEYLTATTEYSWYGLNDGSDWPQNVVPDHAYVVERVDPATGLIYVRNPWGPKSTPPGMTVDEFSNSYSYIASNK